MTHSSTPTIIDCPRCSGQGVIKAFVHRDGGTCYRCKGAKTVRATRYDSAPKPEPKQVRYVLVRQLEVADGKFVRDFQVFDPELADHLLRRTIVRADFIQSLRTEGRTFDSFRAKRNKHGTVFFRLED